ncbi:MAG: hypothetical protein AAF415_07100 [Pseudomonadota bacterium]
MPPGKDAEEALDQHGDTLMELENVVALGVVPASDDADETDMAVAVYVSEMPTAGDTASGQSVPEDLEIEHQGTKKRVPTRVVQVGMITTGMPLDRGPES